MTNLQKPNSKQSHGYDLEERCLVFTKRVHAFIKTLPKSISNFEIAKQLARSSGSVGANYIEANESLSKKDFIMRVKIAKKEAKETIWWLRLTEITSSQLSEQDYLIDECTQIMKILGAILEKSL